MAIISERSQILETFLRENPFIYNE